MARYYTGAYGNQEALAAAVNTVLTGEGWTQDELDNTNDEAGWNRGGDYIQMDWDNTDHVNFYASTAWDGAGTAPGAHTGDSGNTLTVNDIGNAGGTYHAFTNDGSGTHFVYFVLEYASNFYRHFGFCEIEKHGGWAEGFIAFGHHWDQNVNNIDVPASGTHSVLVDGNYSSLSNGAVMRIDGSEWPNIASAADWAVASNIATITNDTDGNPRYRMQGGMRRGPHVQNWAAFDPSTGDAFFPGSPIPIILKDDTHSDPEHWYWAGEMPGIFVGSMENFSDEHEETFGSETWEVFPLVNSSWSGANPNTEQSGNAGIWYRKV